MQQNSDIKHITTILAKLANHESVTDAERQAVNEYAKRYKQ